MRPPTLKSAKKRAWNSFSRYIIARDKSCVTCGRKENLQAGHFWHACLDFDEININAQDTYCNKYLSGNLATYSVYLIKKYGIKEFRVLEKRHYKALKGEKRTIEEYLEIESHYKALLGR